jgi:hypothetical protein
MAWEKILSFNLRTCRPIRRPAMVRIAMCFRFSLSMSRHASINHLDDQYYSHAFAIM